MTLVAGPPRTRPPLSVIALVVVLAAINVANFYTISRAASIEPLTGRDMAKLVGGVIEFLVTSAGILALRWWAFALLLIELLVLLYRFRTDTTDLLFHVGLLVILLACTLPHARRMHWRFP